MSERTGTWRATYTPGDWVVLSGPTSLVVMTPAKASASQIVNRLWDVVVDSSDLDSLVRTFAEFGVDRMPDFGAFFWADGQMRSLVRGAVRAVDVATGDVVADGEGVLTWRETGHGDVRRFRVDMQEVDQDALLQLPLVVGAVTASALVIDATDEAVVASPQRPVPAPAVEVDPDAPTPEEARARVAGINADPRPSEAEPAPEPRRTESRPAAAERAAEAPSGERPAITEVPAITDVPGFGAAAAGFGAAAAAAASTERPPVPPAPQPQAPQPPAPTASGFGPGPEGAFGQAAPGPQGPVPQAPGQQGGFGQQGQGQPGPFGQPGPGQQGPEQQPPFGQQAPGAPQQQGQPYPPGFTQAPPVPQPQGGPGYAPGFAAQTPFAPRQAQEAPQPEPAGATAWAPGQQPGGPEAPGHGEPSSMPSAPDESEALVLAVMCTMGHPNPQEAQRCRRCGNPVQGQPQLVQRPVMATLRPSSGQPVDVDRSVLIGRSPTATRVAREQLPKLLPVPSPSHDISRTHLQVSPEGWELMATDLHSTNGTALLRPGAAEPERLTPGEPVPVFPGCVLDLGDGVTIRVDHPA